MEGNQTILEPPEPGSAGAQAASGRAAERKAMNFAFDKSYWSAGPRDEPNYCSQQTLYDDLGKELLDHGFAGFNACILACECLLFTRRVALLNAASRWADRCVIRMMKTCMAGANAQAMERFWEVLQVRTVVCCATADILMCACSMMGCKFPMHPFYYNQVTMLSRRTRQGHYTTHMFRALLASRVEEGQRPPH